jgi:putative SOS response-associated peptidase YedK
MPVILDPSAYEAWLDRNTTATSLQALLKPYDSDQMRAYPVSTLVNNPRHDDPQVIEPASALNTG